MRQLNWCTLLRRVGLAVAASALAATAGTLAAALPVTPVRAAEPPPLSAVTPLAAAADTNGRLQIVMTRPDDVILRDGQLDPDGRFPGWSVVAGQLRSVAAEADGSGRVVQVGFNGAGQIWAAIQDGPGSSGWLGWSAVDGQVSSVALARNGDGRLELFATNSAGTVFHRTQSAAGAVTFGAWNTLPGQLTQVAAETNADGRIELVGLNAAGLVFDQRQSAPNAASWSGWAQVTGFLTSVAVARNGDGRLQLFGTDPTGALVSRAQAQPGGVWAGGWFSVGDGHGGAVAAETDGRVRVFGRDSGGVLATRKQTSPGSGVFTAWSPLIQMRVGPSGGPKRKVLVIPVNWAAGHGTRAAPPTLPIAQVMGLIDNNWWYEVSYGHFPGWQVTGYGPVTIQPPHSESNGSCGDDFTDDVSTGADAAAAQAGIDPSGYTRVYWFTGIGAGCGWSGKWLSDGNRIYINGGL